MSDDHLILSPPEWRAALREELISSGCEQDASSVIARQVVERLVRRYLRGDLDPAPAATRTLDEAA
jgi:hypothetical protein